MKIYIWKVILFGILIVVIGIPIYAQAESIYYPGEVSKKCSSTESSRSSFMQDGHKYTTYLIARYAGIDEVDAYTLTYYSQYPDIDKRYEATPVALKYLFPWQWQWRSDIMGVLHSLHGGKRQTVLARREVLGTLISKTLKSNSQQYWQAGLMIHALADAYSHTKHQFGSLNQTAYGTVFGHALHLHHPDQIAQPEVFPKYAAYVKQLFGILSNQGKGDNVKLENYLAELKSLICKSRAICSEIKAKEMSSRIVDISKDEGSFSNEWFECIASKARPLTKIQVQAVINKIKDAR
jgi:hypothetical protein